MANIAGRTLNKANRARRAARSVMDTQKTLVLYTTALGRVLKREYGWDLEQVSTLVGQLTAEAGTIIEEMQNG